MSPRQRAARVKVAALGGLIGEGISPPARGADVLAVESRHRGQQGTGVGMGGSAQQLLRRPRFDDTAQVHHRDIVREVVDFTARLWVMNR